MELQFQKTASPCLRWVVRELQNQEQTQEIRLDDSMPDIGRVLCAWGQILLRGKEWHSGGMGISGGVMACVLYVPEDGGSVQCVESWIPFQSKWDFPDTGRDGTIFANCILRSIDARSTSARKLVVRASIGVLGEAIVPGEEDIYIPPEVPKDMQLLKRTYPLRIPSEAGEKTFLIDDELTLPSSAKEIGKIIRFELRPEIIDQKVVAGKAVFRGVAILHMLYSAEDGVLCSHDFEIPFSQYSDLDREYDQNADLVITVAMTNLELEEAPEKSLRLKAGLTGQYVVYDHVNVEMVVDAYSPQRDVKTELKRMQITSALELGREILKAESAVEAKAFQAVDVSFCHDHPVLFKRGENVEVEVSGAFQVLCYDEENALQCHLSKFEKKLNIPASEECAIAAEAYSSGIPRISDNSGKGIASADILLRTVVSAEQGLPMMTGMEYSESVASKTEKPGLILRRIGNHTLWDVAKSAGSTVAAIMEVNQLQGEPNEDQMLLIPIL